jgi:hypothetical protein
METIFNRFELAGMEDKPLVEKQSTKRPVVPNVNPASPRVIAFEISYAEFEYFGGRHG